MSTQTLYFLFLLSIHHSWISHNADRVSKLRRDQNLIGNSMPFRVQLGLERTQSMRSRGMWKHLMEPVNWSKVVQAIVIWNTVAKLLGVKKENKEFE